MTTDPPGIEVTMTSAIPGAGDETTDVHYALPVSPHARARGETEEQRLDRNYVELLQELRVAQTGTQILFAFLLTMAFTPRFVEINEFQRGLYVVILVTAALATVLIIGPVSFHRIVFRRRQKRALVESANLLAIGGLVLLAVSMTGSVLLVLDVVIGGVPAMWLTALVAAWFIGFWYVLPFVYRRRG